MIEGFMVFVLDNVMTRRYHTAEILDCQQFVQDNNERLIRRHALFTD